MDATDTALTTPLNLDCVERWDVFHRLQALAIACECSPGQPLRVAVSTPTAAIQVWSVVQHCTQRSTDSPERLERCWRQGVAQWR
ncbi:MAG: hypothetical protein VKJ09_02915 [Leptolyngbya sp.]|nr:hypothetical protein [Leptolyngbya sp.]